MKFICSEVRRRTGGDTDHPVIGLRSDTPRLQGQKRWPRQFSNGITAVTFSFKVVIMLGSGSGNSEGKANGTWSRPHDIRASYMAGHNGFELLRIVAALPTATFHVRRPQTRWPH